MRRASRNNDNANQVAERGVAGAALLVIALVMACRIGWLAVQAPPLEERAVAQAAPQPVRPAESLAPSVPEATTPRLTHVEAAMLSAVCPTALDSLPAEVLPEPAETPSAIGPQLRPPDASAIRTAEAATRPPAESPTTGRLTGVRVASRSPSPMRLAQAPTAPPEGWLVSPERWFVAEDRRDGSVENPDNKSLPERLPASSDEAPTPSASQASSPAPKQTEVATPPAQGEPFATRTDKPVAAERSDFEQNRRAEPLLDESVAVEADLTGPLFGSPTEDEAGPELGISKEDPSTLRVIESERLNTRVFAPPAPETQQSEPLPAPTPRRESAESVTPAMRRSPAPLVKPAFEAPRAEPLALPLAEPIEAPAATPHGGFDTKKAAEEARAAAGGKSADESHRELFARNCYPSARQCAECHERIYNEWSVSSHAYAFVSPMFQRFEETISKLSNGTVGHFCYRCHSPVGTAMGELRSTPIGELAEVAREGVTCIACHRVNQRYGKSNGDRRIVPGDRYAPIYGGVGGDGVAEAIANKDKYKVKTSESDKGPGVGIHNEGRFFDQLTQAEACTSCHQVAVHPGIKLEVVWEQYRASPACKKGVTCQECHMGRVPGMAGGYNYGPVAEINGKTVNNHRKQSSHLFYGPGYSIAHPGIFPQHKDAANWKFNDWLLYDWRAGWGTDEFEDRVEEAEDKGVDTSAWFPKVWADVDDRYDAREVIDDNLERLKVKRRYREIVMENGSKVEGPFFRETPTSGEDLEFDYIVTNLNEGHNLPTASLGAQPQLWANVVLIGPDGRRLWETGYTDSNGDLCDIHSVDVRHGRIPFDKQLFNLQTMFLITGATGTDREFYLPVNFDIDPVAQLRPGAIPITVTNHPPFIRMEMRSISPLGKKRVKYTVPKELVRQPGCYRLSFRLRSRTEPMYFMRLCESTPEMLRSMIEGTLDIHPYSVEFKVR